MFAKLAGFLLLFLVFGVVQANADSVYEIIGTLQVPGNSSNPGVGESINYSFMLDYTQLDGSIMATFVGTPTVTSFGPLGTFSIGNNSSQGYVGFFSSLAEIDLLGYFSPIFNPIPVVVEPWLFSCSAGRGLLNKQVCSPFYTGLDIYGTANASVYLVSDPLRSGAVATPEPGTLCLSVLGALALMAMTLLSRLSPSSMASRYGSQALAD